MAPSAAFKALGLERSVITGAFLAFLLSDIVGKAIPAFTTNVATLKVMVDPRYVDAANPKAGDYQGLFKKAWQAQFPDVTSRGDKKKLNGLISARAADALQDVVEADPSLIGKEIDVPLAFSSEADLYLKG